MALPRLGFDCAWRDCAGLGDCWGHAMIGKRWMRLLREGLLDLYAECGQLRDHTVYYMALDEGHLATRAAAVRSLHTLEFLPWPEDSCIIAVEEPLMPTGDPPALAFIVRSPLMRSLAIRAGYQMEEQDTSVLMHFTSTTALDGRRWQRFAPAIGGIRKIRIEPSNRMEEICAGTAAVWGKERGEHFAKYWSDCQPLDKTSMWLGEAGGCNSVEITNSILSALSNLAIPCHYRVLAQSNGFGNKATREAIRAKPFICIVAFDRLYTSQPGDGNGHPKTPHARCGHIRHLWKEAGLNRNALPPEPEKRLRLVADHHVRRIYVHPSWIGARTYAADGMEYEIQAGESELPMLH